MMHIRRSASMLTLLALTLPLAGAVTLAGQSGHQPDGSQSAQGMVMKEWPLPPGWNGPRRGPEVPPTGGPLEWMREQAGAEAPCPPGWCDSVPERVLVKLKPPSSAVRTAADVGGAEWQFARDQERAITLSALQEHGIRGLEPVFPTAVPPPAGRQVLGRDGAMVPVPDLTRWYIATIDGSVAPGRRWRLLPVQPAGSLAEGRPCLHSAPANVCYLCARQPIPDSPALWNRLAVQPQLLTSNTEVHLDRFTPRSDASM